jgi:hypothetical protein
MCQWENNVLGFLSLRYPTYGAFLKDLRLIFSNAKAYNGVHMDVDEVSKNIYDAAVMFEELVRG